MPPARRALVLANPNCQGFGIGRSPLGSEVQAPWAGQGGKEWMASRAPAQCPQFPTYTLLGARSPQCTLFSQTGCRGAAMLPAVTIPADGA